MMQQGKFGKSEVLSDADRLAEVERKFSVISDRIQAYDKILVSFAALKDSLDSNKAAIDENKISVGGLADYVNAAHSFSLKSAADAKDQINNLSNQISVVGSFSSEAKKQAQYQSDSIQAQVSKVDAKHTELGKSYLLYSDLDAIRNPLNQSIDGLRNQVEFLTNKLRNLNEAHTNLSQKHDVLNDSHSSLRSQLVSTNDAISAQAKNLDISVKSLKSSSDLAIEKVKDQVVNYMDATKIEMIGAPSSLESVKKEILGKLTMTSLDGSNAALRSSNNEAQIRLLEKKLENLAILVKKNEIAKM